MLGRGLGRRGAVCGEGLLYRRYFELADRRPGCGFRFERREGQFVGAVGLSTIVTFGLVLVVVVMGSVLTAPDIPVGPLVAIAVAVAIVVPVLFHPIAKTLWCAIDIGFDPLQPGEAPGLEFVRGDDGGVISGSVEGPREE